MAVAAASRPVVHGLQTPRSPTLSDAGMILPDNHNVRSFSPNIYSQRPPALPALYTHSNSSHVKLAPANQRRASQRSKSPSKSARSSRSTPTMGDLGATTRHGTTRDDALASSPTIENNLSNEPSHWTAHGQRRLSTASSSVLSEDFDNWPGFDSHDHFDDSGVDLEEQEKRDQFPSGADNSDEMAGDRWLNQHSGSSGSDDGDDPSSSAALSRRAEIILANAKKRLNVMEGNLRGARESLVVSPTLNATRSSSELSLHLNTARERDRRLYAGLGPIPPRVHSYRASPLSPTSPGHTRGQSETSVPLPFSSPSYMLRTGTNKRASSAIGHTPSPWSPEGYGHGRFPIKESRSHEVMREPEHTWNNPEQQHPVRSSSRKSSRSPPGLETLQEDEDISQIKRSSSAASGLRDQMNDLKGRISSLKQRAQEDQLRRRSMQSLRTSSPFTNAQEWYSEAETYQAGGAPVTANAGLGIRTDSPTRRALFEEEEPHFSDRLLSQLQCEKHATKELKIRTDVSSQLPDHYEAIDNPNFDDLEPYHDEQDSHDADETDFASLTDETEFASLDSSEPDSAPPSVYEDAVYEMPATARHEDRVDAFDYEHFFLHSAMGTYSLENRRNSTASDSSTATTRPVTAVQAQEPDVSRAEKRVSYHTRNPSADSVSTVATFATAAEEQDDDEGEAGNEEMDQFEQRILSAQHSRADLVSNYASLRSDSAINMHRRPSPSTSPPSQFQIRSNRTSPSPADLASGLQISKIFHILTDTPATQASMLSEEEKQLMYSVAAGLQGVCEELASGRGDGERKVWRERLKGARRCLSGEGDLRVGE